MPFAQASRVVAVPDEVGNAFRRDAMEREQRDEAVRVVHPGSPYRPRPAAALSTGGQHRACCT
jgi:hypothetical protein